MECDHEVNLAGVSFRVKDQILHLLKRRGAQTAIALSEQLQVSPMAIRQHLQHLQAEQCVTYQEERRPIGRPVKLWQLTEQTRDRFPDSHADLMVDLLRSVETVFGEAGLEQLVSDRSQRQIQTYQAKITDRQNRQQNEIENEIENEVENEVDNEIKNEIESNSAIKLENNLENDGLDQSWQAKVNLLAQLRSQEGYMAEVVLESANSLRLIENHCPICAAAQTCQKLCHAELSVFQAVLGSTLKVERIEHILSGDRRCVYRISGAGGTTLNES